VGQADRGGHGANSGFSCPKAIDPESVPVTIALDTRNSLITLGGSIALGLVLGILVYAVAGSVSPDEGGFLLFVGVAGAILLGARSIFRIAAAPGAVVLDNEGITLGPALGYIPQLTIARSSVAAIETVDGQEPMVAVVTNTGRRYEVRTDQMRGAELPNYLAALWPDVAWRSRDV